MKPWSIFAFDTAIDRVRLASECASWGIARAVLHPGFVEDGRFATALRAHGRELWLNLPVFFAPEQLQAHPARYAVTWRGERAVHGWLELVAALRARAPGVPPLVKTIPWAPEQLADGLRRVAGQDLEALAQATDGALPMALTHFLGRDPAWRRRLLDDVERRTGKPVGSYLQVDATAGERVPLSVVEDDLEGLTSEDRAPVVFCYELLARDPERAALVRRYASSATSGG